MIGKKKERIELIEKGGKMKGIKLSIAIAVLIVLSYVWFLYYPFSNFLVRQFY